MGSACAPWLTASRIDAVKTCMMACPRPGTAVRGVAECSGDRDAERRDDRWWERVADLAVDGGLTPAEPPGVGKPCSRATIATVSRGIPLPVGLVRGEAPGQILLHPDKAVRGAIATDLPALWTAPSTTA